MNKIHDKTEITESLFRRCRIAVINADALGQPPEVAVHNTLSDAGATADPQTIRDICDHCVRLVRCA